jgi:hypothetical protein
MASVIFFGQPAGISVKFTMGHPALKSPGMILAEEIQGKEGVSHE